MKRLADIKRLPDIIEIRKLGKAVISEAPMFAELLAYHGADAARCLSQPPTSLITRINE